MKFFTHFKLLLVFFYIILSYNTSNATQNSNYSLICNLKFRFPVTTPFGTSYFIVTALTDTIPDGTNFTIGKIKLESAYSAFQSLADALNGSIFGLETGSLKENASIDILIDGLQSDGKYPSTLNGANVFLFISATVTVNNVPVTGDYYFQTGKRAYWKFYKTNLSSYIIKNISDWNNDWTDMSFSYYLHDDIWTNLDISVQDEGNYYSFYAQHFSKLAGGRGRTFKQANSIENDNLNPSSFELLQNYPNPFNPTTTISYNIPENSFVKLVIYDILGNEIKTLVNNEQAAGIHKVNLDASMLSSGTYFYKLSTSKYSLTKKMLLIK